MSLDNQRVVQIITLVNEWGWSVSKVARDFNVTKSRIYQLVREYHLSGEIPQIHKRGRKPKELPVEKTQYIIRFNYNIIINLSKVRNMFVSHEYQVSIFGLFNTIPQDSKTVIELMEYFKKYNVVPQIFPTPEGNVLSPVSNPQIPIVIPPPIQMEIPLMTFISATKETRITIFPTRIDVCFHSQEKMLISKKQIEEYQKTSRDILRFLIETYCLTINRIALNTMDMDVDSLGIKINKEGQIFTLGLSTYNTQDIPEWTMRVVKKDTLDTGNKSAELNIITTIERTNNHTNIRNKLSDQLAISFDINTAITPGVEKTYEISDVDTFIEESEKIKSEIMAEILGEELCPYL